MTEFEASAEPLQNWLNSTEIRVQESSVRLHDLLDKKQELNKLQVLENSTFIASVNCKLIVGLYSTVMWHCSHYFMI